MQRVEERGLQPRERVVETVDARSGEAESLRVALLGELVDHGAARIGQSHRFGTFIEGFARSVVDGRTDDPHFERRVHAHDLRVSSAHEQTQKREIGMGQLPVGKVDEVREDVSLQVVDLHHRDVAGDGESFGERHPHEQRSQQTRSAREGDGVEFVGRDARFAQRRVHHRHDVLLVGARGQFGDHAAVFDVNGL